MIFMKIANIVCAYPPYKGGIGTAASDFRKYAVMAGFNVRTFTPDYGGGVGVNDEKDGVERIKPILRFGNGAFLPQLFFCLQEFDIAYLHYPFFGGAEAVWLWKLFNPKKKLIIHYHMDTAGLPFLARALSLPSRLIANDIFRRADLIVSASLDYVKNGALAEVYKKYPEKFREIPYGVDIERFHPEEKSFDKIKILFVGGLDQAHYFKGVDKLLEALALLKEDGINEWELDIVGSGDLQPIYQEKAKFLSLSGQVCFLGNVSDSDLPGFYARSHLTVLPSVNKAEAFGIVLIESMAAGTPVLASDLTGVRGVFTDGYEGLSVRPGDVCDLKEKIKNLISDSAVLKIMGKRSRALAESRYSSKVVAKEIRDILMLNDKR